MHIHRKLSYLTLVWRKLFIISALALVPASIHAQAVLSPERIHKSVSPSVAVVKDFESHGSGVVISKDGLLITNYHVVASGLPLDVTVKVKKGSKVQDITYKNLKVWKVHPKYDLALIQLPNEGVRFAVAKFLSSKVTVNAGAQCYAIGNPAGMGGALAQSITNGLVSSANRVVDGLKYIQVSCALNPGNSGGAICDNKGTVIGIATWKLGQAENIGFAIPTNEIQIKDFIPIKDRKPNFELAKKYEQEAAKFANMALDLQGDDRELAIRIATAFYRKTLENVPNDPAPYNNIGAMYFRLKEDKIARKYLERALEIKPLYANSAAMLGIIMGRTFKDEEAAIAIWYNHINDPLDKVAASDCMENISISYINQKKFAQAAYAIKWANSINPPRPHRKHARDRIWQDSAEKITEAQFDFLKSKVEAYSKEEMMTFATGKIAKSNINKNDVNPNDRDDPSTPKNLTGILRINKSIYTKFAKEKLSKAIDINEDGLTLPIPGKPGKMIMGYAGAYLLIEFPELKRLGVFDICAGRMCKYISLPEAKSQFAAGGDILVIFLPETKKIQLWDMKTWTMKSEKNFRSARTIHGLGMGLLNHNFALVNLSTTDRRARDGLGLLSLPDCKITIPKWTEPQGKDTRSANNISTLFSHLRDSAILDVEETGRYATVSNPSCSLINFSNELAPELDHYFSSSSCSFILGGQYLLSQSRTIYSKHQMKERKDLLSERLKKHNPLEIPSHRRIVNIAGFSGFAHVAKRLGKGEEILVRDGKTLNVLSSTALPKKIYDVSSSLSSSYSVFASAYVQRCIFVDKKKKTLSIFPLALDDKVIAKVDQLAKPGAPISRVINVPAGSKVSIEGDLKGASFDPKTNTLTWKIPVDFKRGTKESIILLITDKNGKMDYHVEQIYVP